MLNLPESGENALMVQCALLPGNRPMGEAQQQRVLSAVHTEYGRKLARKIPGHHELYPAWLQHCDYVLDDCYRSLTEGRPSLNEEKVALAAALGVTAALAGVRLDAISSLWAEMNDVFLATLPGAADAGWPAPGDLGLAFRAVNRSTAERARLALYWYEKVIQEQFRSMRREDQRNTARELHDWFGSNISLAMRKLELHDLEETGDKRNRRLTELHSVLAALLEGTRRFSQGLRLRTPASDIREHLRACVSSFGTDLIDVVILVDGDERQAPREVLAEVFTVLREALRNVFTHSGASNAMILVDITPRQVCAVVQDDGKGFDTSHAPLGGITGTGGGLLSMKERVQALDGAFSLLSQPGYGTRIAFWIPNAGGVR